MPTARLVEVYREHRIVSDGRLFGVEANGHVEYRYPSMRAARAAIDSELRSAEYRAFKATWTYVEVPPGSDLACSCCGGIGSSSPSTRRASRQLKRPA